MSESWKDRNVIEDLLMIQSKIVETLFYWNLRFYRNGLFQDTSLDSTPRIIKTSSKDSYESFTPLQYLLQALSVYINEYNGFAVHKDSFCQIDIHDHRI
jgi:hypothetical protein